MTMKMVGWQSGLRNMMLALACFLIPAFAGASYAAVVSGSFVYKQEKDGSLIRYQVTASEYQGVAAWRVSWDCPQLKAEHFVRQSDGAPLYVKRVNLALKRTVEIIYSQQTDQPTIYRKRSADEFLERKIHEKDLRDIGSLPQLLVAQAVSDHDPVSISFNAINYDDGEVYPLTADPSGFRRVKSDSNSVRCVIYDIKLDSWMAALAGKTRLLIPTSKDSSNFVSYSGPGLDSVSDNWSLTLVGRDTRVAMVSESTLTQ